MWRRRRQRRDINIINDGPCRIQTFDVLITSKDKQIHEISRKTFSIFVCDEKRTLSWTSHLVFVGSTKQIISGIKKCFRASFRRLQCASTTLLMFLYNFQLCARVFSFRWSKQKWTRKNKYKNEERNKRFGLMKMEQHISARKTFLFYFILPPIHIRNAFIVIFFFICSSRCLRRRPRHFFFHFICMLVDAWSRFYLLYIRINLRRERRISILFFYFVFGFRWAFSSFCSLPKWFASATSSLLSITYKNDFNSWNCPLSSSSSSSTSSYFILLKGFILS